MGFNLDTQATRSDLMSVDSTLSENITAAQKYIPIVSTTNFSTSVVAEIETTNEVVSFTDISENLFEYSEQLDNAYWDTSGASVTANATTDPDGTTIADKVISTSTSGSAVIKTPTGLTASAEYTMSIFAKAGDNNIFRIANVSSGTTGAWFNLTDGTIGTQNGGTNSSTITPVGDGWYKCTRTFPSLTVSGNNTVIFGNCSADGTTSGPPVGEFMYLWGAMLNEGPKVNKYIKTEASASTTIERGELSKDFYDAQ